MRSAVYVGITISIRNIIVIEMGVIFILIIGGTIDQANHCAVLNQHRCIIIIYSVRVIGKLN